MIETVKRRFRQIFEDLADRLHYGAAVSDGQPSRAWRPIAGRVLLALLVFLVPGFAQWLWARAEPRPRALPAGRPERPG